MDIFLCFSFTIIYNLNRKCLRYVIYFRLSVLRCLSNGWLGSSLFVYAINATYDSVYAED